MCGPDRPGKFNDGPVRSMNLPDRCISVAYTLLPGNERFTNELIELELSELNAGLLRDLR